MSALHPYLLTPHKDFGMPKRLLTPFILNQLS